MYELAQLAQLAQLGKTDLTTIYIDKVLYISPSQISMASWTNVYVRPTWSNCKTAYLSLNKPY